MAFVNHTPLHCLPFEAFRPSGSRAGFVIVRMTMDMVVAGPALRAEGLTHHLQLSREQAPLALTDEDHEGGRTASTRWESDLAPEKPRCDVIVLGEAHAPAGRGCRTFLTRVRITAAPPPHPPPPRPVGLGFGVPLAVDDLRAWHRQAAKAPPPPAVLVDKSLQMTGERWLVQRNPVIRAFARVLWVATLGLVKWAPWRLTAPKLLTHLPLRYEYGFGGWEQAKATDSWVGRIPAKHRRTPAHPGGVVAEPVWAANPSGRGYLPAWFARAARRKRLAAPQIEDPTYPFQAAHAWSAMEGRVAAQRNPALKPQGFGVMGREWSHRRALAGTWDEAWAASGTPYPRDFSSGFNNLAHPDLQCRWLDGDELVELVNLCPPDLPGAVRDASGNQNLRFRLPGIRPFLVVVEPDGQCDLVTARFDTLVLEPSTLRATLVMRARHSCEPPPVLIELRMAMAGEPLEVDLGLDSAAVEPGDGGGETHA